MKAKDTVIEYRDFHYADGFKAGIKEVVDYIKSEGDWDTGLFIFGFAIDADIWNAKLKEWDINP